MKITKVKYDNKEFLFNGRGDDPITKHHVKNNSFYECETLQLLYKVLLNFSNEYEDISIIDAGANIGNHSIFFAHQFPNSKVFSFEMNPETFSYLKENIKNNNLNNIIAINKGLSNNVGYCGIKHNKNNPLGGAQLDISGKSKEVSLTTIDSYFDNNTPGTSRIALIKIDVEGHELPCLEGAISILKKDKPLIFIECKESSQFKEILNLIQPLNYRVIQPAPDVLPNFIYIHADDIKKLYPQDILLNIIEDLSLRHVQSWQLRRDKRVLQAELYEIK